MLAEGETHPGDDPIEADLEAHRVFTEAVSSHPRFREMGIREVVGEERLVNSLRVLRQGERLVVLDPLDGSSQWAMIRSGHCVAALVLVGDGQGNPSFESALIATPVHTFTLSTLTGLLQFGSTYSNDERISLLSCLPEAVIEQPSIAFTGYKTKDRRSVLTLAKFLSSWSIVTLGGNPVTPYVVAGGLTAALTLRPQYTWDAIGILMATKTDAVVGDLDGTMVYGNSFEELFNRVALTGNARVIPPMVVTKSRERYEQIVEAVSKARDEFGPGFGSGNDDLENEFPLASDNDNDLDGDGPDIGSD